MDVEKLYYARGVGWIYGVSIDDGIYILTNKYGDPIISKNGRMMIYDERRKRIRVACKEEEKQFRRCYDG